MYNSIESKKFPDNNINYCLCDEPLVEVKDFLFEPFYRNRNIKGATDRCFMSKGVYERLKLAQSYLPDGLRIKIYDAWRPFEVQLSLYEDYRKKVTEENPLCTKEEIDNLTKLFVSLPVKDEVKGPVHTTGGALDVTLADENGTVLNMGTEFDFFGDKQLRQYPNPFLVRVFTPLHC